MRTRATLALLVAERLPGIRACAAFAPVCDVPGRVGQQGIQALSSVLPGFREFLQRSSPDAGVASLKCPCFLFHADDDRNVPSAEVAAFAAKLQQTNPTVTFVRVLSGGHYDSMIRDGIPRAIEWLRKLPGS